uniref:Adhesion G protein-coupled receptor B1 n=1 Tax=Eptatretus burgeri TaxID=7764 RepID=A0A8C4X242_EPTBU
MPEARRTALLLLAHCCCCCLTSLAPEPMASTCWQSTRDISGGAFSLRVHTMEDSCGWVVVNPKPRTSTVFVWISKGAHTCSRYLLLTSDLETLPPKPSEPQTDMCAEPASTILLASRARYLHLRLKSRNVTRDSIPPVPPQVLLEYITLNDADRDSGCRALCAWVRRCTHHPEMVQMPRSCDPRGIVDKGTGHPTACRLNYTGGPVRPPQSHDCHNSSESNGLPTWRLWSSWCPCLSQCLMGKKELRTSCSFQCGGHVACLSLFRNWRHCGSSSCSNRSSQVGNVPHKLSVRSVPAEYADELNYRSTWPLNPRTGEWSTDTWSRWSSCSVSCGHGSQLRTRSCQSSTHDQHCGGPLRESRSCNSTQPCPVHGVWDEWSPWSLCSTTCGRGFRDRSRSCAHPIHGGQPCDGYDRQTRSCNIALCPIDGHWSKWTSWSLCSVTCGNGTRQRTRDCHGPAFGGSDCRGPWAEERPCSNAACTEFTEAIRRCKDQNCPALHGFCKEETLQGLTWKKTSVGKSAINRCPSNATGIITRPCSLDSSSTPYWQKPSFARCISHNYRRLIQSNYVQVLSNLLWIENKGKWEEAQQLYLASLDFVKIVEDFIQIISTTVKAVHTSYLITENIVISIRKLFVMEETRDMTFPTKARRGMVSWVRNSEDKVFMSKETLSKLTTGMQESAVVGNVLYKNLGSILPTPPNGSTVNSRIVSVTINPPPKSLVPPLEIMFSHLHNVSSTSYCVLWDGPKLDGGWSQDGCTAAFSDASHTRCACERASTYAIFTTLSNRKDMVRGGISSLSLAAGCVVSSLALTFLIIAYCIFWRAIKSDRSVILINFCVSIISSNILILIGQTQVHNKVTCSLIAGLLHFFFLASFCWVLTEAWQSYMAVIGRLRSKIIRKRFLCLGWGLPALVVAISIGFTKTKGYGTANYCWLSLEGGLLYAFVGPAAVVVLVNMIIGILVFNKLVSKEGIPDKRLKHRAGASLWSSCVVLPLLALTWMSAVLAITDKRSGLFQILFALFDSLQGIVIVIVHCILRKEVQDALKCRLRSSHDQVNGDSSASFPNGHVQIMSDFEKDVDLACRSVLRKDINTCRQTACKTTVSTTLSSFADEAFDKKDFSEVVGSPSRGIIPAGLMPDVQLLGPPNYMAPLGGSASIALVEGPWGEPETSEPKPTGLFAGTNKTELQIASDLEFTTAQRRALESDYVILPRGTTAPAAHFKASPQDLATHGILLGPVMEPSFEPGLPVATLAPVPSSAKAFTRTSLEHPFDLHSIFQGLLGKVSSTERKETTLAALRSETSSNVSISSLERRKPRYSELDFEKIMRTRKRHQEMFQELSQKFQSVEKADESPRNELVGMQSPSKVTWESMHRSSPQPYLEPHSQTELPGIEWENPSTSIPLNGNDSDIQTEV